MLQSLWKVARMEGFINEKSQSRNKLFKALLSEQRWEKHQGCKLVDGDFLMILVTSSSVTGLKLVKEQLSCLCSGKSGKLVSSDSDCSESVIVLTLLTKNY